MMNAGIVDVSKRTEVLWAVNVKNTEKNTEVKVKYDSPLAERDVVITLVVPSGDEQKAMELIQEILKARDNEPQDIKKKIIIVTPELFKQKIAEKVKEQTGLYTLFEDNGRTVNEKMNKPQYVLEFKTIYNRTADVYFSSLDGGVLLSVRGNDYPTIANKLITYLKTGKAGADIPTEQDKDAAKKKIDETKGYYFEKAWAFLMDVPEEREAAYAFLKENYKGNKQLFDKVNEYLWEELGSATPIVGLDKLIELLCVSASKENAADLEQSLIRILKSKKITNDVRDLVLERMGTKEVYDKLVEYMSGTGNKTKLQYEIKDRFFSDPGSAKYLAVMMNVLVNDDIKVFEQFLPLLRFINEQPEEKMHDVFWKELDRYFVIDRDNDYKTTNGFWLKAGSHVYFSGIDLFSATLAIDTFNDGKLFKAGCEVHFQHNGTICEGVLAQDTEINGVIYKGDTSIWLYSDGKVNRGTLSKDATINGYLFKADSLLFLEENGTIDSVSFYKDTEFCGRSWKAGMSIEFDNDNHIERGHLFEDAEINGFMFRAWTHFYFNREGVVVRCEVPDRVHDLAVDDTPRDTELNGVFVKERTTVLFHDNGKLKEITLAQDTAINGYLFKAGSEVEYNEKGRLFSGRLARNSVINGYLIKDHVSFHDNGNLMKAVLVNATKVNGYLLQEGIPFEVHENGRLAYGTLAKDTKINGIVFKAGSAISIKQNGSVDHITTHEWVDVRGEKCLSVTTVFFNGKGKVQKVNKYIDTLRP